MNNKAVIGFGFREDLKNSADHAQLHLVIANYSLPQEP